MKTYPEINKVYQLAGIGFESPWQCLTCSTTDYSHVIMKNLNTGEIRECKGAEITEEGNIQWGSSGEVTDDFSIQTYTNKGMNKQNVKELFWTQALHLWKYETLKKFPDPTIWLGKTRLIDGRILLEPYEKH